MHSPDSQTSSPRLLTWTIGAVLLSFTLVTVSPGCAEQEQRCTFDSECRVGSSCVQGSCYQECTSDEECTSSGASSTCVTIDRGTDTSQQLSVCAPEDRANKEYTPNATTMSCEEDQICKDLFRDERARCSILATCIIPPEEHAILLTPTSNELPVEIVRAYMEDEAGEYLGALRVDRYQSGGEPLSGEEQPPMEWNHEPPIICDQERPLEAMTLEAPEGFARLGLFMDEGRELFQKDWRVVLVQRADACPDLDGSSAVNVEVLLCIGLSGDPFSPEEQCTRELTVERREAPAGPGLEAVVTFTP